MADTLALLNPATEALILDQPLATRADADAAIAHASRAMRMARGVDTGTLSINSNSSVRFSTPFGGFKRSGLGRELSMEALNHYSELKTVFWAS